MLWYRTGSRYRDLHFLAARFGDKIGLAVAPCQSARNRNIMHVYFTSASLMCASRDPAEVFVSLYWKIGAETELASVQCAWLKRARNTGFWECLVCRVCPCLTRLLVLVVTSPVPRFKTVHVVLRSKCAGCKVHMWDFLLSRGDVWFHGH